jgi:cache 3/cache 2 fusion protein/uncharacterized protein DUF4239
VFYWIYDYPSWLVALLFAGTFFTATVLAIFGFRRFCHSWFHSEHRANDMVGFVLSSFSVLYGLLVGLIAVAAYQNYSNVLDIVTREAGSLSAVYHDLHGYPKPIRGILQDDLRDYTRYVIDYSWPDQRHGVVPVGGSHRVDKFIDDLLSFQPSTKSEEIVHAEAFRQVNTFVDLRRARLDSVTTGIPGVLWWVVGLGALINILLIAMLDMQLGVHLVLGSALSVFLGLVIFLIAAMDNPFRGQVSIGPGAFEEVYDTQMRPDDAVNRSMADLVEKAGKLGAPKLEGRSPVAGRDVPGLYFGASRINNDFGLVDQVVQDTGGTATLFVKSGEDYVRVATNIRKPDGSRAIGTVLDPAGPAIQMIRKGEAFYGEATILGAAYITGYEPIKDAAGRVIGVYYVGYRKPQETAGVAASAR